jgi:hypothetical protein
VTEILLVALPLAVVIAVLGTFMLSLCRAAAVGDEQAGRALAERDVRRVLDQVGDEVDAVVIEFPLRLRVVSDDGRAA